MLNTQGSSTKTTCYIWPIYIADGHHEKLLKGYEDDL